jgi:hypothetical protein
MEDTGLQIAHGNNGTVRVESEKGKQLEVTFDHILEPSCAQVRFNYHGLTPIFPRRRPLDRLANNEFLR